MDIDGTLARQEGVITPKARQALLGAQRRGIQLVLASG